MSETQPTLGRVVWLRPEDPEFNADARLSAEIAFVNADGTVNLAVLNHNGSKGHSQQNVVIVPEGANPEPGQCEWPHASTVIPNHTELTTPVVGATETDVTDDSGDINAPELLPINTTDDPADEDTTEAKPMETDVTATTEAAGEATTDSTSEAGDTSAESAPESDTKPGLGERISDGIHKAEDAVAGALGLGGDKPASDAAAEDASATGAVAGATNDGFAAAFNAGDAGAASASPEGAQAEGQTTGAPVATGDAPAAQDAAAAGAESGAPGATTGSAPAA